jgi:hypothetical protein
MWFDEKLARKTLECMKGEEAIELLRDLIQLAPRRTEI